MSWARGDLAVTEVADEAALHSELARLAPREILVADDSPLVFEAGDTARTERPAWLFDAISAGRKLTQFFGVAQLDGFGCGDMPRAIAAAVEHWAPLDDPATGARVVAAWRPEALLEAEADRDAARPAWLACRDARVGRAARAALGGWSPGARRTCTATCTPGSRRFG